MARWHVKRWVIEEFEVEADTREEALQRVENPFSVKVTKETCTKAAEAVQG